MFETVHHTAYVVEDMDAAVQLFSEKFGLKLERRFVSGETEFAIMPAGNFILELLSPARADSKYHETLRQRGGNDIGHVGYGVHNLDGVLEKLRSSGISVRADGAHIAATGWRVASLEPDSTLGIRLQLVDLDHDS